jgi:hypothetical protein
VPLSPNEIGVRIISQGVKKKTNYKKIIKKIKPKKNKTKKKSLFII